MKNIFILSFSFLLQFFLQATQLGQIQADYAEVKLQKNSAKEILSKKEEVSSV